MGEPSLEQIFGSYTAWKLDEATWILQFMNGSEYMYLLEGDEKALLLDTGYGAGNLRAFVENLTDKEIIVANTHYHPDHAAGNGEFEKVYMSAGWTVDAPSTDTPGAVPFDISKLPHADYEHIVIGDGYKFELGGRTVEVVEPAPAHCNSTLFFLDRGHRMFFCGDDMESAQVMMYDNSKNPDAPYHVKARIDNMKANAERIKSLEDEFDYLLPNHNGTPISKAYIDEFIELADAIYAGDATIEDDLHHPFVAMDPIAPSLCRVKWKHASIFIIKKLVLEIYGTKKS